MKIQRQYNRLKSASTIRHNSLIEVFERGLQIDIETQGINYNEISIDAFEIINILELCSGKNKERMPSYLKADSPGTHLTISVSQRIIELLPALAFIRKKYEMEWSISVYVNTIVTALAPLEAAIPFFVDGDSVVVNTQFTRRCITTLLGTHKELVRVRPPIPELCRAGSEGLVREEDKFRKKRYIASFSRLNSEKGTHELIKAIQLLPDHWHLSLYGFDARRSVYQEYLANLAKDLGMQSRISLHPQLNSKEERLYALLEADVIVNTSTSFEETMGKSILEALSWGKPVVANCWNGFVDLLPETQLIPTYWSEEQCYHVKAEDIAKAVINVEDGKMQNPEESFNKFLLMRDHESILFNNSDHLNGNHKYIDPEVLEGWLTHPRIMTMTSAPNLMENYAKALGEIFAPSTTVHMQEPLDLERPSLHPRIIVACCQKRNIDPIEYLKKWVKENLYSPYRLMAESMIREISPLDYS